MDELAGKSSEYFQAKNQIQNLYDQMIRGRLRTAGCGVENNLRQNYTSSHRRSRDGLSAIYPLDKYLGKQKHYPLDRDFSSGKCYQPLISWGLL